MCPEEVRYWLYNLEGLKEEISIDEEELRRLQELDIPEYTTTSLDGMPRSRGNTSRPVETVVVHRVSCFESIKKRILTNRLLLLAINHVIMELNETEFKMFNLKYVKKPKPTMYEIAKSLNYSIDYCKKIDTRIVKDIITEYNNLTGA